MRPLYGFIPAPALTGALLLVAPDVETWRIGVAVVLICLALGFTCAIFVHVHVDEDHHDHRQDINR